ncbi:hypothetical protein MACK_000481 [Theileria orientalis]|uniref:Uncharacterized protein n=1 Tax=Theileria orientalis TaxID=68886 RepID=A0A976QS44_THEOR|nr:hypothetical protein MACK_000481 [Theileria orientalis]
MKSVKCVRLFLLVYGISIFKSDVHCAPGEERNQIGRSRFVEVDLKDIYKGDLEVEVDRQRNEVRKITPRNKKLISLVKVDEEIIWKKSGNSRCVNLLMFLTSSDKMIVILNTRSDGQKQYVNIVYDPTVRGEEPSRIERRGKRTTYIGLLPLIMEMNEEFGTLEKYKNEIFGVELNIKDRFDEWYYEHKMSSYIAHSRKSKPVLNYVTYEPNEKELFVKITDDHRSIWLANPSKENIMKFCKKVEVYLKHTSFKLMRLTLVEGQQVYYKYNFIISRWVKTDQKQFMEMIKYLGFNEVLNSNQEAMESRLPIGRKREGTDAKKADSDKSEEDKADNTCVAVDVNVSSVDKNKGRDQSGAGGVSMTEEKGDDKDRKDGKEAGESDAKAEKIAGDSDFKAEELIHESDAKAEKLAGDSDSKPEEPVDRKKGDDESDEVEMTIPRLNIWDINEEDFQFTKRKMSLLRMITITPKRKRKVEKLYFNEYDFRYINSYDFKIEFIKWKNTFHITETMVKYNDRKNYFTYYLDKERGEHIWKTYTQDEFYRKIIEEIKYFDVDNIVRYHHFALLDEISEIVNEPNYKKLINVI